MHLNGENVIKWWETCLKYTNGQKIYVYEKNDPRGLSALAPGLYICTNVYDHNIQTSSLKPLG